MPEFLPRRGDAVEGWLVASRDASRDPFGRAPAWYTVDALLEHYRVCADLAIPLDTPVDDIHGPCTGCGTRSGTKLHSNGQPGEREWRCATCPTTTP